MSGFLKCQSFGKEAMNKKIIKTTIEWLLYIIFVVLIIWGTPKVLAKVLDTPYPIASITSSSMWPVLKSGDMVFIKGVKDKNDINVGDIVVYNNPSTGSGQGGFTIHRVVKLDQETFITKGDANNVNDQPVKYDELIGKTVNVSGKPLHIPYLGKLSQIFKK